MSDVIYILFGLHILLCIVYALDYRYDRGNLQNTLLRFVICFFVPVFGFAFLWFSDFFEKRMKKIGGREKLDFQEKRTELELLNPLDLSEEINRVPMVEALQMGDYSFRRKVVVDTMREDALDYIDVLKTALLNEDSETSHYASSVIMDVQGKLHASLFEKEVRFQEEPEDSENTYAYEKELYRIIKSGIYEKRDLHKYYVKYKVVSDYLLKQEEVREKTYHNRIEIDLETEDVLHAGWLCEKFLKEYPASEDMVVDFICFYIKTKDKEGLEQFLINLKSLPVVLSSYALQYIRFFERENQ
ncbi:MAG: hypothetical protein E7260_00070 [Lachnospiraceae bacterium]|nr:hypothetical protein [Lachnospiraceae bacterium]